MYGLNAVDDSRLMNTGDVDAHVQVLTPVNSSVIFACSRLPLV